MKVFLNPLVRSILYFPMDHQQASLHGQEVKSLVTPLESDSICLSHASSRLERSSPEATALYLSFLLQEGAKQLSSAQGLPCLFCCYPRGLVACGRPFLHAIMDLEAGQAANLPEQSGWQVGLCPIERIICYCHLSLCSTVSYPVTGDTWSKILPDSFRPFSVTWALNQGERATGGRLLSLLRAPLLGIHAFLLPLRCLHHVFFLACMGTWHI